MTNRHQLYKSLIGPSYTEMKMSMVLFIEYLILQELYNSGVSHNSLRGQNC